MPPGLARKRLWNRKYPICITLADGEVGEEEECLFSDQEEECNRAATTADRQRPVTLYLFGRTGREKEEWFQHFLSASRADAKWGVSCEESTGVDTQMSRPHQTALYGPSSHSLSFSQRPRVAVTPPGKPQRA